MKSLDAYPDFSSSDLGEVLSRVPTESRGRGLIAHKHAVILYSSGKIYSSDENFVTNINPDAKIAVIIAAVGS